MGRLARIVVPGHPHHITQRGNRRQQTSLCRDDYAWSSAAAHPANRDDRLVKVKPLLDLVGDWAPLLSEDPGNGEVERFYQRERIGRPPGDERFVANLSNRLHRVLSPRKRGPKTKSKVD